MHHSTLRSLACPVQQTSKHSRRGGAVPSKSGTVTSSFLSVARCSAGGEWFLCDDGWVGRVPAPEVRSAQAFQLFYARTDLVSRPLS